MIHLGTSKWKQLIWIADKCLCNITVWKIDFSKHYVSGWCLCAYKEYDLVETTLKNPKKFGLLFKLPLTSLYKKSLTVAEKLKKHSQVV